MGVTNRKRSDRDLISALTIDYLNVYLIRPEEDSVDVIKLDGYITEGIEDTWTNLKFSTLLENYTKNRVHPEEQDKFRNESCAEHLIEVMKTNPVINGRYKVLMDKETHYYAYKYVKVSSEGEPLRLIAAYKNIDEIVTADQRRIDRLQDIINVKNASKMGIWHIALIDGQEPRMAADDMMKELLGISLDESISEEEIYRRWNSGIDVNFRESVQKSVSIMLGGKRDENTYKWHHPTLGERYVRCGGYAMAMAGGYYLSGYHYDVTDQINKEIRSKLIITSLAHSYEMLFYIRLYNRTFITYADNVYGENNDANSQVFRDVDILRTTFINSVSTSFRDEIEKFCDLSTIEERMANRNFLVTQFKDKDEVWHELSFVVAERHLCGGVKHLLWAVRKIDDEKQVEIRRQRILEDNIAANKAKTLFLHNMSHEIRTPLNAMFGFSQLLGLPDGSWTNQEKDEYNNYIFNSYNMLDMLIGDIIDIADSEHGNYRIEISDVHINEICRNAMMSAEFRKPAAVNMYYTTDVDDAHTVKSDSRRIQQVLINYLTNACKHTQEGEIHLHCSTSEHPGKLTFSVTDTGEGVPADKAEMIFNRFTKLNQFVQGSGLGLNICRMIATKLGGEVYLDTSYSGGARFVFMIDDAS